MLWIGSIRKIEGGIAMCKRIVKHETDAFGEYQVRIVRDYEWDEYSVECVRLPYFTEVCSYHTDDLTDAKDTFNLYLVELEEGKIS